jgi:hypothetical protein
MDTQREPRFRDRTAKMAQVAEDLRNIARQIAERAAFLTEESDRMAAAAAKFAQRRDQRQTTKASR